MKKKKIRYAVVGLGHIAQAAILPAFKESKRSHLSAIVSSDHKKLEKLGKKYRVDQAVTYDGYDRLLKSGEIDAVYIALPNHLHADYALRAMAAGVHVLCEKPLTIDPVESKKMIRTAKLKGVKLMTAYRLHFDPANLAVIRAATTGKIGNLQFFTSEFGHTVKSDNIRMDPKEGGGPLNDLGIYCLNTARNLFRAEPQEVFAVGASPDPRFSRVHETITAVLRFPEDRLATFTCSFGCAGVARYRLVGSKGDISIEDPYEYVGEMVMKTTVGEKSHIRRFKTGDQFAAELEHFSDCILNGREPAPSGAQGLADVTIIEALYRSIREGKPVRLGGKLPRHVRRPVPRQAIRKPSHGKTKLINTEPEERT